MTPSEALQAFAQSVGWGVRADGDICQLVDVDRGEAHTVVATMATRGGKYPARLIFKKQEVPDVISADEKQFQAALSSLKELEAFRHLIVG